MFVYLFSLLFSPSSLVPFHLGNQKYWCCITCDNTKRLTAKQYNAHMLGKKHAKRIAKAKRRRIREEVSVIVVSKKQKIEECVQPTKEQAVVDVVEKKK